jgi:intracellular sulfur oxidation DsrE/DsrF family protein
MFMLHIKTFLFIFIIGILTTGTAHAEQPNDADALEDISEGKVVWDITTQNPKKLLVYLNVIQQTYDDLVRQDVKPDMVFTFRGPVLKLISTQPLDLDNGNQTEHEEALDLLKNMSQRPGVKMESCSVAARLMGIDNETIIPEVKPVGNTFVSLIGYQHKGYALIPIY